MWSPTHVQVTVQKARDLLTKGKNGTNDAFVTIALGKEKYQTSVKEKVGKEVEWHEECELQIPKQGNTAEIVLTVLHRNFIGVDEFLGVANIPLADFDVYERPRNRWYTLKCKPGKDKNKPRGELEVKVAFTVKAGSLTDLSKKEKHKSSLGQLSHMAHSVGGSLLSIGSLEKRKGLKKLAKSIGHKMSKNRKDGVLDEKLEKISDSGFSNTYRQSTQVAGDADPGVISEDDDEFTFDDLSHKSSESSLSTHQTANTPVIGSLENLAGGEFLRRNVGSGSTMSSTKSSRTSSATQDKNVDEWEQKLYGRQGKEHSIANMDTPKRRSWDSSKTFLTSQPEEEEPIESITQTLPSHHSPSSTLPRKPSEDLVNFGENVDQEKKDDDKEKEKEKEMSKLARKFKNFRRDTKLLEATVEHKAPVELKAPRVEERIIIGGENEGAALQHANSRLSSEILQKFDGKSREDLIEMVCHLQGTLEGQNKKVRDLEDYLDNLLLRVMETTPRILQNPYVSCKTQAGLSH